MCPACLPDSPAILPQPGLGTAPALALTFIFSDPSWKVLAIIAAAQGAGKASFSVGGTFEETDPGVNCCSLEGADSGAPEFTVAGVASAIASGAIAVACSDLADPF